MPTSKLYLSLLVAAALTAVAACAGPVDADPQAPLDPFDVSLAPGGGDEPVGFAPGIDAYASGDEAAPPAAGPEWSRTPFQPELRIERLTVAGDEAEIWRIDLALDGHEDDPFPIDDVIVTGPGDLGSWRLRRDVDAPRFRASSRLDGEPPHGSFEFIVLTDRGPFFRHVDWGGLPVVEARDLWIGQMAEGVAVTWDRWSAGAQYTARLLASDEIGAELTPLGVSCDTEAGGCMLRGDGVPTANTWYVVEVTAVGRRSPAGLTAEATVRTLPFVAE